MGARTDDPYRLLFEEGPAPSWVFDEETLAFLAVNDAAVALYGYTRDEFLAMTVREVRPASELPSFDATFARFRAGAERQGAAPAAMWHHKKKNGDVFAVEVLVRRFTFEGREAIVASIRDVSRLRDPAALEARERRFRALVEYGADCIFLIDITGTVVYASPATTRAIGRTPEEVVGTRALDHVHPDDVDTVLRARRSPPGSRIDQTYRLRHRDGTWRWFEGTAMNLLDDPAVAAIVSNNRDVTERRAAEEQLRFQAAVLAQVNEAVLATDITGRIIYWNEAAERLYGYAAQEAIGRDGTELLKTRWPNPADLEAHAASLRATSRWRGEMVHVTKSGDAITVEASIRVLRDDAGRPVAGIDVLQDVTARRRLEEQLRQSQKMEAIGVFAGGVAHDFNNLLGVILGFTDLTLRRLPPDHPDAAALGEVVAAAQRGSELTRKLLAFSRKQIMRLVPLDLNAAIADFAKLLGRILGEDVELVVSVSSEPLVVRADPVQVEQVLFNLCTNARQAMPNGGKLVIRARESVIDGAFVQHHPWVRPGRFAELVVSDTGTGMDPATAAHVFEPFFTTKPQGTGLGLATVYGIVQQHEGFATVESVLGVGTTFRVYFPRLDAEAIAPPRERSEPLAPSGHETILVAEDAAPLRALVTSTLASLGYRVLTAEDGEEAVRAYERHAGAIALVVLDVVMPKLGALQAYERMRAVRPDVKAVFTTGYAPDATELAKYLAGGRVRLLEKPFTSRALAIMVRGAIDAVE